MTRAARPVRARLGHERRQQPLPGSDLLDRALEQERLVGRLQRRRRAQVDLVLPRARLWVARLDGEPVLEQRLAHGARERLVARGRHHAVHARALVDRDELRRALAEHRLRRLAQQIELDLTMTTGSKPRDPGPLHDRA